MRKWSQLSCTRCARTKIIEDFALGALLQRDFLFKNWKKVAFIAIFDSFNLLNFCKYASNNSKFSEELILAEFHRILRSHDNDSFCTCDTSPKNKLFWNFSKFQVKSNPWRWQFLLTFQNSNRFCSSYLEPRTTRYFKGIEIWVVNNANGPVWMP